MIVKILNLESEIVANLLNKMKLEAKIVEDEECSFLDYEQHKFLEEKITKEISKKCKY